MFVADVTTNSKYVPFNKIEVYRRLFMCYYAEIRNGDVPLSYYGVQPFLKPLCIRYGAKDTRRQASKRRYNDNLHEYQQQTSAKLNTNNSKRPGAIPAFLFFFLDKVKRGFRPAPPFAVRYRTQYIMT